MIKPIFVSLHPHKTTFAAVFYNVACVRTLYIGKTSKTLLFAAYSRFRVLYVVSTNFRLWYVCSRLFLFPFSLAFCSTKIMCETLCKFLYFYASLKCMFTQSIMINRKLFGNLEFSAPLCKRSIFLLFVSLLFLLFWIIYRKRKQKRKSRIFAVKRPFLSQIKY